MPTHHRSDRAPGLARLLADLPRERLIALAMQWVGDGPDHPGLGATLYHQMTDPARLSARVASLDDATRLVLARLAVTPTGLSLARLAERLPFDDATIARAFAALEELGLAWRTLAPPREPDDGGERWTVPRDLASSIAAATRPPRIPSSRVAPLSSSDARSEGSGRALAVPASHVRTGGAARDYLTLLVARSGRTDGASTSMRQFARQCGLALGVLARNRAVVRLGPRADIWASSSVAEQTRALARIWLVDLTLGVTLSPRARRLLVHAVVAGSDEGWRGIAALTRGVASQLAVANEGAETDRPPTGEATGARRLAREHVERAVGTLAWLGVLDVAIDDLKRPVAARLTAHGRAALS
jgi:hypothetical protein